eukprot:1585073-Rhodomonas_salina.1
MRAAGTKCTEKLPFVFDFGQCLCTARCKSHGSGTTTKVFSAKSNAIAGLHSTVCSRFSTVRARNPFNLAFARRKANDAARGAYIGGGADTYIGGVGSERSGRGADEEKERERERERRRLRFKTAQEKLWSKAGTKHLYCTLSCWYEAFVLYKAFVLHSHA